MPFLAKPCAWWTADTSQHLAKRPRKDSQGHEVGSRKSVSFLPSFQNCALRKNRVPWDLQKLWLGHANKDVTDRYAEQLKEDVEWRKEEAERVGLGFTLPALDLGYVGLPKQQKSKLKKVA